MTTDLIRTCDKHFISPSRKPVIWFICSPKPKVQLNSEDQEVTGFKDLKEWNRHKIWIVLCCFVRCWFLIFPQLWCGHWPHKVHAFLSEFLVKWIILRNVYREALGVNHELAVIRAFEESFSTFKSLENNFEIVSLCYLAFLKAWPDWAWSIIIAALDTATVVIGQSA